MSQASEETSSEDRDRIPSPRTSGKQLIPRPSLDRLVEGVSTTDG
jgi:hypothetical protein